METLKHRVDCLEADMKELGQDVKLIMNNHLPHIEREISTISAQIKIYGAIIMIALTAIIGLVVTK